MYENYKKNGFVSCNNVCGVGFIVSEKDFCIGFCDVEKQVKIIIKKRSVQPLPMLRLKRLNWVYALAAPVSAFTLYSALSDSINSLTLTILSQRQAFEPQNA